MLQAMYIASSREAKRLDSISQSPIFSTLSETGQVFDTRLFAQGSSPGAEHGAAAGHVHRQQQGSQAAGFHLPEPYIQHPVRDWPGVPCHLARCL